MIIADYQKSYYAFFSTYTGATTSDPKQMWVPIDDHGFHRGDGVFEAMKWVGKKIWLCDSHLTRLEKSCQRIGLKLPLSAEQVRKKLDELVSMSNQSLGLLRIFVTRGPGGFGVNPYESTQPQMYIVATELKEWSHDKVLKGVSIQRSSLIPKKGLYAQVKSLNYLPNVLMKKEAVDNGFDFSIGVGEHAEILESSTENLSFIKGNCVYTPLFESTLRGTSLVRLTELMAQHTNLSWQQKEFNYEELLQADEVFVVGTTIGVMPVTRVEDHQKNHMQRTLELRMLVQNDQL